MDPFAVSHFSNDGLRHDLKTGIASDCMSLAARLTRIAEFDDRKLYLQDGFPSMFAYCVHELHLSEGAAYRRITAARTARRFPAVLMAVADGRVHLRAVLMLAPRLTTGNVDELLAAATHKTRVELEQILARRFRGPICPNGCRPFHRCRRSRRPPRRSRWMRSSLRPGSPPRGRPTHSLRSELRQLSWNNPFMDGSRHLHRPRQAHSLRSELSHPLREQHPEADTTTKGCLDERSFHSNSITGSR